MERIRRKLLAFISSDKDMPLLAGFSIGFYMMLFYYSRNFDLANSLEQLLFFIGYYVLLPMTVLYTGYKVLGAIKLSAYRKHFLFIAIIGFIAFFITQIISIGFSKKLFLAGILVAAALLSIVLRKYYKLFIVLLFLMSVFNVKNIARAIYAGIVSSSEWKKQPDDIENIIFKQFPNIYYIQPDGYTSFSNLRNSLHNFDNTGYESFLAQNGFTLYEDYRSNYFSTLLSNSATFSMKHHYFEKDLVAYSSRHVIMADNPVLKILKKNKYKTHFITESPYLLINRPGIGYDSSNISLSELPYLKDGLGIKKDVSADFKNRTKNSSGSNFYFIEKFIPGHITVYQSGSKGVKGEKDSYLDNVGKANTWLKEMILHIERTDPDALVIIGADHGGFAGFENTLQCFRKTDDPHLVKSIFGAHLAIKWPGSYSGYDKGLKSGVNLFRTVFSFLAQDKKYLNNLQDNSSYIRLTEPIGTYRYIDANGNVVFDKIK